MPTIQIACTSDFYIRSGAPASAGDGALIYLGRSSSSDEIRRYVETYSMATVLGKVIVSARFRKFVLVPPASTITFQTRQWVPPATENSATWLTRDGSTPWTTAGGDIDSSGVAITGRTIPNGTTGEVFYGATALVQNAVARGIPLYAIHSEENEGGGSNRVVVIASRTHGTESNRPYLEVVYEEPSSSSRRHRVNRLRMMTG